ncbi:MAG: aldo/keto reductase [Bacteroidota bacterium]
MKYHNFGSSELKTSSLGLGMAALGRPGYINLGHEADYQLGRSVALMQERAFTVLDTAWEKGVRYFDTARSYGRGEAFLGAWLQQRKIPPDQVLIGSKWGYTYTADWQVEAEVHEVKEHSRKRLEQQYPESKALLGEYLNIYHIHSATQESKVLQNTEVLGKLAELKAEGLLIGLSLSGPQQSDTLGQALEVRVDGQRLFDSVQITWNLLENSSSTPMAEAKSAGMGVIVKEALANGRLTERNQAHLVFSGRLG